MRRVGFILLLFLPLTISCNHKREKQNVKESIKVSIKEPANFLNFSLKFETSYPQHICGWSEEFSELYVCDYTQKAKISINSNATLLTPELVKFFKKNGVIINISIDLNERHHNFTRRYKNGKKSFEDILGKVELLRKNNLLGTSFQGTIEKFELIDKEKIGFFQKIGFSSARISPNLLGKEESEGEKIAFKFFELVDYSSKKNFLITDNIFDLFNNVLKGSFLKYAPFCNGLGANIGQSILYYNISRDMFSYICQYVPGAYISGDNIKNIFDSFLLKRQISFMKQRMETIIKNCLKCPIVGFCRGGCVIDGINSYNQINKAGCIYIKTLWFFLLIQ